MEHVSVDLSMVGGSRDVAAADLDGVLGVRELERFESQPSCLFVGQRK